VNWIGLKWIDLAWSVKFSGAVEIAMVFGHKKYTLRYITHVLYITCSIF